MKHGAKVCWLVVAGGVCALGGLGSVGLGRALAAQDQGAETGQMKPEGAMPMGEQSTTMTTTGTIQNIDKKTRMVTIKQDNGEPLTVKVPPEAKHFDQLGGGRREAGVLPVTGGVAAPAGRAAPERRSSARSRGNRARGWLRAR